MEIPYSGGGYMFFNPLRIDKTASALLLGMLMWIVYALFCDKIIPIVKPDELAAFVGANGVGGSILIIGSAAGVIAMGLEKIPFGWYLRKFSLLALLGYGGGAFVFWLQTLLF